MKKFQILFLILTALVTVAASFIDPVLGGAVLASAGVAWPAGGVDIQTPAYAATIPITIADQFTIINPAILTGALTINLTITPTVRAGAVIQTLIKTTATEVFTAGTGFTGPTQTGVAGKTKSALWIYDGTTFKMAGTPVQID